MRARKKIICLTAAIFTTLSFHSFAVMRQDTPCHDETCHSISYTVYTSQEVDGLIANANSRINVINGTLNQLQAQIHNTNQRITSGESTKNQQFKELQEDMIAGVNNISSQLYSKSIFDQIKEELKEEILKELSHK